MLLSMTQNRKQQELKFQIFANAVFRWNWCCNAKWKSAVGSDPINVVDTMHNIIAKQKISIILINNINLHI